MTMKPFLVSILADDFLDDKALRNAAAPSFVCDGIYVSQVREKPLRQQQAAVFDRLVFLQERSAHTPVTSDRRRVRRV